MEGLAVACALRADEATAVVTRIASPGTVRTKDEDRRRSREVGFVPHLTKPVHPDELQRLRNGSTAETSGRSGTGIRIVEVPGGDRMHRHRGPKSFGPDSVQAVIVGIVSPKVSVKPVRAPRLPGKSWNRAGPWPVAPRKTPRPPRIW